MAVIAPIILALAPQIVRVVSWLAAFLIVEKIVGLGDKIVEEGPVKGFGLAIPLIATGLIIFAIRGGQAGKLRIGR